MHELFLFSSTGAFLKHNMTSQIGMFRIFLWDRRDTSVPQTPAAIPLQSKSDRLRLIKKVTGLLLNTSSAVWLRAVWLFLVE